MERLDIAVAGCGPAGLATALMLHRDGHRVVLFERFDEPRPLGSGIMLQPTGLAVLHALGLRGQVEALAAPVDRLIGRVASTGRTVLDVGYDGLGKPDARGYGIHRASLFAVLFDAVAGAGIPVETQRQVAGATSDKRRRLLFDGGRSSAPFDLIVDALGSHTTLAPPTGRLLAYGALWASLDWPDGSELRADALEQRYERASIMVGVLPIGQVPDSAKRQAAFFWSLRADRLQAWKTAGLTAWRAQVQSLWPATAPLLDQIDHPDRLTFARYAHRTLPRPAEPGLAHIGDAWHSASPQLGQGANMALLDGYALARAIRENDRLDLSLETYVGLRRGHVRLYQALTDILTPVYQSDSHVIPALSDRVVGPLSKLWPIPAIQAGLVSGLIGFPLRPLGLA